MDGGTRACRDVFAALHLLADLRRVATAVAQVIELRTADVTAAFHRDVVDGGVRLPSPFFFEIARFATDRVPDGGVRPAPASAPAVLSAPSVVGRLRAVVCAPDGSVGAEEKTSAATQLARLAHAGVPGADPAEWHGMSAVSTADPLWCVGEEGGGHTVTLSPSTLQMLQDCPLRWLLERHGGADRLELRSVVGSLVHALIAEPGADEARLLARLDEIWAQLPFEARWFGRNELDRHRDPAGRRRHDHPGCLECRPD